MEERLAAIEEQLQKLNRVDELQDSVLGVQEELRALVVANQRHNGDHYRREGDHGNRGGYHRPTQFTKMDFPKFQGQEIDTWILKCERFFALDETPDHAKVTMASMHLDDVSFAWHVAAERRWRRLPTWEEYVILLRDTFGIPVEKPMSDLTRLRQTGSLAEFNARFDAISAKLELNEEYLVDIYVAALRDEIAESVLLFNPRTLREARRLARVQEIAVNRRELKALGDKGGRQMAGGRDVAAISASSVPASSNTRQINNRVGPPQRDTVANSVTRNMNSNEKVGTRSWRATKTLSAEDEAEHRAKNLCFYCHERFSRDHKCPQRQRMQLHYLEVIEESDGGDLADQSNESDDDHVPLISLHAINGVDTTDSMHIQGNVGKRLIQILVDNGSTHDFLDYEMAVKLGWRETEPPSSWVQVAGGRKLQVYGVWQGFRWRMQGMVFQCDLRIIKLQTFDMVLGITWLKSIKSAFWDYERLSMQFWYKGQLCTLQAKPTSSCRVVPASKLGLTRAAGQHMFLVRLLQPSEPSQQGCTFPEPSAEEGSAGLSNGIPAEVQSVLSAFADVFSEPRGLPPLRKGHNHPIVL